MGVCQASSSLLVAYLVANLVANLIAYLVANLILVADSHRQEML